MNPQAKLIAHNATLTLANIARQIIGGLLFTTGGLCALWLFRRFFHFGICG